MKIVAWIIIGFFAIAILGVIALGGYRMWGLDGAIAPFIILAIITIIWAIGHKPAPTVES